MSEEELDNETTFERLNYQYGSISSLQALIRLQIERIPSLSEIDFSRRSGEISAAARSVSTNTVPIAEVDRRLLLVSLSGDISLLLRSATEFVRDRLSDLMVNDAHQGTCSRQLYRSRCRLQVLGSELRYQLDSMRSRLQEFEQGTLQSFLRTEQSSNNIPDRWRSSLLENLHDVSERNRKEEHAMNVPTDGCSSGTNRDGKVIAVENISPALQGLDFILTSLHDEVENSTGAGSRDKQEPLCNQISGKDRLCPASLGRANILSRTPGIHSMAGGSNDPARSGLFPNVIDSNETHHSSGDRGSAETHGVASHGISRNAHQHSVNDSDIPPMISGAFGRFPADGFLQNVHSICLLDIEDNATDGKILDAGNRANSVDDFSDCGDSVISRNDNIRDIISSLLEQLDEKGSTVEEETILNTLQNSKPSEHKVSSEDKCQDTSSTIISDSSLRDDVCDSNGNRRSKTLPSSTVMVGSSYLDGFQDRSADRLEYSFHNSMVTNDNTIDSCNTDYQTVLCAVGRRTNNLPDRAIYYHLDDGSANVSYLTDNPGDRNEDLTEAGDDSDGGDSVIIKDDAIQDKSVLDQLKDDDCSEDEDDDTLLNTLQNRAISTIPGYQHVSSNRGQDSIPLDTNISDCSVAEKNCDSNENRRSGTVPDSAVVSTSSHFDQYKDITEARHFYSLYSDSIVSQIGSLNEQSNNTCDMDCKVHQPLIGERPQLHENSGESISSNGIKNGSSPKDSLCNATNNILDRISGSTVLITNNPRAKDKDERNCDIFANNPEMTENSGLGENDVKQYDYTVSNNGSADGQAQGVVEKLLPGCEMTSVICSPAQDAKLDGSTDVIGSANGKKLSISELSNDQTSGDVIDGEDDDNRGSNPVSMVMTENSWADKICGTNANTVSKRNIDTSYMNAKNNNDPYRTSCHSDMDMDIRGPIVRTGGGGSSPGNNDITDNGCDGVSGHDSLIEMILDIGNVITSFLMEMDDDSLGNKHDKSIVLIEKADNGSAVSDELDSCHPTCLDCGRNTSSADILGIDSSPFVHSCSSTVPNVGELSSNGHGSASAVNTARGKDAVTPNRDTCERAELSNRDPCNDLVATVDNVDDEQASGICGVLSNMRPETIASSVGVISSDNVPSRTTFPQSIEDENSAHMLNPKEAGQRTEPEHKYGHKPAADTSLPGNKAVLDSDSSSNSSDDGNMDVYLEVHVRTSADSATEIRYSGYGSSSESSEQCLLGVSRPRVFASIDNDGRFLSTGLPYNRAQHSGWSSWGKEADEIFTSVSDSQKQGPGAKGPRIRRPYHHTGTRLHRCIGNRNILDLWRESNDDLFDTERLGLVQNNNRCTPIGQRRNEARASRRRQEAMFDDDHSSCSDKEKSSTLSESSRRVFSSGSDVISKPMAMLSEEDIFQSCREAIEESSSDDHWPQTFQDLIVVRPENDRQPVTLSSLQSQSCPELSYPPKSPVRPLRKFRFRTQRSVSSRFEVLFRKFIYLIPIILAIITFVILVNGIGKRTFPDSLVLLMEDIERNLVLRYTDTVCF